MASDPSGGAAIGGTLTGGIQDIAALLPLLGTEQCEDHVASGITNGYLCVAATPMLIFSSPGAARAGFKTLLSAISVSRFIKFDGPYILNAMGFAPQGENLRLIMLDQDGKYHCAEKRLESMLEELHIEDSSRVGVSSNCRTWNIMMILATAVACIVSITPYIHINLHEPNKLNHFVRWVFPVIRAIGSFLTVTMIQLVTQNRVLSIMRKRLILNSVGEVELKRLGIQVGGKGGTSFWIRYPRLDQRCSLGQRLNHFSVPSTSDHTPPNDVEKVGEHKSPNREEPGMDRKRLKDLQSQIIQANGSSVLKGIFLGLLLIGIIASVVGYIGCFSVVQGGLSIIRIFLWGFNPKWGDAPPLEFKLKFDKCAPLPTCTRSAEEIEKTNILPLVRGPEFLKAITLYAGVLTQFNDPRLSLYYTLTRRDHATESLSKRVLYIAIFDHTERTTRVYSEGYHGDSFEFTENESLVSGNWGATSSDPTHFYSADALTVDLEHNIPTTRIRHQIHYEDDPIAENPTLRTALTEHYHSILRQVNSGIGNRHPDHDTLMNQWTLQLGAEKSLMQDQAACSSGCGNDSINIQRDCRYLDHGLVEQHVRKLIVVRGEHIKDYMNWLHETIDDDLRLMTMRNIKVEEGYKTGAVEAMLIEEQREMELMLVDEVTQWEEKLRECRKGVVDWLSSNGGMDAKAVAKLKMRWRANKWERLEDGEVAMRARTSAAGSSPLRDGSVEFTTSTLEHAWRCLFYVYNIGVIPPCPSLSIRLENHLSDDDTEHDEATLLMQGRRRWQTDYGGN